MNTADQDQALMDELIRLWPDGEIVKVKGNLVDDERFPWMLTIHMVTASGYRVLVGVGADQHEALADLVARAQRLVHGDPDVSDPNAPF